MGCSPWTCKESWMTDWLTHWTEWDWESWEKVLEGRIYRVYTRLSLNWIWRKIRVVSSSSFVFNNRMFWVYHFALYTSCKERVLGGVKKKKQYLANWSMGSLSRTRLSNFTFTFHFHALEKEMATHSSVLAWRIPGMGEPGGLPSMGSHRVGHDWSDLAAAAAAAPLFIF